MSKLFNISKDEVLFNWEFPTLGEIVIPSRTRIKPSEKPSLSFIGMNHIEAHTMKLLGTVSAVNMKSSAIHFMPGDVLYGRLRPYLNKVYSPNFEGLCSAEFIVFPSTEGLYSQYLKYFLNSSAFVKFSTSLNTGDRPRVKFEQLASYPFPLPPFEQQKRIVAEIEKQFSRLDEAVDNLKRIKANLKRYKASVLKAAVEGKLTEEWRKVNPDVEPADKLLERILVERRRKWEEAELAKMKAKGKEPKDDNWKKKYKEPILSNSNDIKHLPNSWMWTNISHIIESMKNGIYKPRDAYAEDGVACLRMYNIEDGKIVWKNIKRMKLSDVEIEEYKLLSGDLLVNRVNSRELVGKTAPIPDDLELCVFESKNIRVRLLSELIVSEFVSFKMFVEGQVFFSKNAQQVVGMASISQPQLASLPIPLPPYNEQKAIVITVKKYLSVIDKLESEIIKNLKRADRLRQSILKKAFAGKLVPQINNDESPKISQKQLA